MNNQYKCLTNLLSNESMGTVRSWSYRIGRFSDLGNYTLIPYLEDVDAFWQGTWWTGSSLISYMVFWDPWENSLKFSDDYLQYFSIYDDLIKKIYLKIASNMGNFMQSYVTDFWSQIYKSALWNICLGPFSVRQCQSWTHFCLTGPPNKSCV